MESQQIMPRQAVVDTRWFLVIAAVVGGIVLGSLLTVRARQPRVVFRNVARALLWLTAESPSDHLEPDRTPAHSPEDGEYVHIDHGRGW